MTNNEWENVSRPTDKDGRQYHIQYGKGGAARYCLLPGDPKRAGKIARMWDSGHLVADYREHVTYTGEIGDMNISACSTEAGGGSTVNTLKDLARVNCNTLTRVGAREAIQTYIKPGDLIIYTGMARKKGTSDGYVTNSYSAVTDREVTTALIEAAEQLGYIYHARIRYTAFSSFCGQGRPGYNGYSRSFVKTLLPDMQAAGVLNFEMEAATTPIISSLCKVRTDAISTMMVNRVENSFQYNNSTVDHNLGVANLVMQLLWE